MNEEIHRIHRCLDSIRQQLEITTGSLLEEVDRIQHELNLDLTDPVLLNFAAAIENACCRVDECVFQLESLTYYKISDLQEWDE